MLFRDILRQNSEWYNKLKVEHAKRNSSDIGKGVNPKENETRKDEKMTTMSVNGKVCQILSTEMKKKQM